MLRRLALITFLTLGTLGCVQSVWVHEKKSDQTGWCSTRSLKGIPFRAKTTIFVQVTTWEKRWKNVKIQRRIRALYTDSTGAQKVLEVADPPSTTRTPSGSKQLATLRNLVAENASELQIVQAFQALPRLDPAQVESQLAGNELKREDVVDPERELYLNSPLPWFGTSNLTAKLASDGTLTEATSSADTKLAEGISTLLPIKEVLSGVATNAIDAASKMKLIAALKDAEVPQANVSAEMTKIVFELTIEDEGLVWEFQKPAQRLAENGMLEPIPFEPKLRPNSVKTLPTGGSTKSEKKDNDRTVSISGEVTLPKAAGSPK